MAINATDTQTETETNDCLNISVWADPLIDQLGHDPRSTYVEQFWLGILGRGMSVFNAKSNGHDPEATARPFDVDGQTLPIARVSPEPDGRLIPTARRGRGNCAAISSATITRVRRFFRAVFAQCPVVSFSEETDTMARYGRRARPWPIPGLIISLGSEPDRVGTR